MSKDLLHPRIQVMIERHPKLVTCIDSINTAYEMLRKCYESGGKVLVCGNGGSAADSDHISGELLKGFASKRPISKEWKEKLGQELFEGLEGALPTIPLPNFKGLLTAFCNDRNPEHMYAQLVWGLGTGQDILLVLTTSGNSKNILHAVTVAKAKGMKVIAMTGESGGKVYPMVDVGIRVPSSWTPDIQEFHLPVYHVLCLMLEDYFFEKVEK